jgi:serine-type D-Ala-D-Ala carboxypeptidase (penicillin-binding protein 5/6)
LTKPYSTIALLLLFLLPLQAMALTPAPPDIKASGFLLMDMHSHRVLAEKNADARMEPASLTKIVTAHVVFDELRKGNLKMTDKVFVSEKAWKTEGSRMFIKVNSKVTVEDLLKGLIIQSGNDAAVALAEHIAGSEDAFANLMNEHAAQLGMTGSHFVNATGLPDKDHYTTPRDIEKVTEATIKQFPELYKLYADKEFTYNNIHQLNRNSLLWRDPSVDGVKTGHTKTAGFCLVSSAKRDGMRLIAVVMGTESMKARINESQALLNYGFRFYETHRLYSANTALVKARVWKGETEHAALGLTHDLYVTIPRRQYDKLKARTEIDPDIQAPVSKGQTLGKVIVELNGEQVAQAPLQALADVPKGGLWRQMVDSAKRLIE